MKQYDVIVIGSGPGGQKAAIQASKLGKKAVIIEKQPYVGGAGLHTGTLPSKTLRETAVMLSGIKQRAVYGFLSVPGKDIKLSEMIYRKTEVVRKQMEVIVDQFSRNNVDIIFGEASFADTGADASGRLKVIKEDGSSVAMDAGVIVIATGSRPARPHDVQFDKDHIYDSDTILGIESIPENLAIIGGGVIGVEYACIFASLGVKVTLVEKKKRLLAFADEEVVTSLMYWMRQSGVTLRLDEEVIAIEVERPGRVVTRLKSGKIIASQKLLYTMGRVASTDKLNLKGVGITSAGRGYINVDANYMTAASGIYAIGDCIGFPSLASVSMEQGRKAVCNAFSIEGQTCEVVGQVPMTVYAIPEISMIGETEESLTGKGVMYEVGTALFNEVAKGQIIGDTHGMVKLIFERSTRKLLGVHIVGERASELIHIGQAVLNYGGTVDYFKDNVFNYPTLSEAYKEAAHNGINKL